ncbi:hypothetical protein MTR67_047679 [Solanum verrucosum]|uniref:Retrotransposon gag domain-containing protein n=1 Tax=Solanum verrucosum TaxID=315347 RepID=A0AAF0UYY0_SOLVR|nr:hypothetical protein MTR67_047679 [Solanum verrucosum]
MEPDISQVPVDSLTEQEESVVDASPLDWEKFKGAFLDSFFPLEMREAKVIEFINLRQGNMSVKEYVLKFTQLDKYAPTLVAGSRARMSKLVLGVLDLVVQECRTTMLINEMDISHLMIHAQQIEEENLKKKARESKKARTGDGDFSHSRMSNVKPQGRNGYGSFIPACTKCDKKYDGKCLADMDGFFNYGKNGHKMREFPWLDTKKRDSRQVQPSGSDSGAPK